MSQRPLTAEELAQIADDDRALESLAERLVGGTSQETEQESSAPDSSWHEQGGMKINSALFDDEPDAEESDLPEQSAAEEVTSPAPEFEPPEPADPVPSIETTPTSEFPPGVHGAEQDYDFNAAFDDEFGDSPDDLHQNGEEKRTWLPWRGKKEASGDARETRGLRERWSALSPHARASIAVVSVLAVIGGIGFARSGGGEPAPEQQASPGNAVVANQPEPPAVAGGSDNAEPETLTPYIGSMNAKCGSGSNDVRLAFSSLESEAWVCTRSNGIDGAILNIHFKQPVTVSAVEFVPGFNYVAQPAGDDYWQQHRVITDVLWRLGGKQVHQQVAPSRTPIKFTFEQPITTSAMSMTIQKSIDPQDSVGGKASDQLAPLGDGDPFSGDQSENTNKPAGELKDATAVQGLKIIGTPKK